LVLGSIGCLVLRINIHSLVPHSKRSKLPERTQDMSSNEKYAHCWSYFSVVFGQLLSSQLHSEEQVFLPLSLLLCQRSHHATHVIEHIIVHCDNVMQCDRMPLCHPQGAISKWHQYFYNILHNRPFNLSCAKCPVIRVFCIVEPHASQFT
jgi:hypothetical protein